MAEQDPAMEKARERARELKDFYKHLITYVLVCSLLVVIDLADSDVPEAYERLLLDCMKGDATLYAHGDSVEYSWAFVEPILDAWAADPSIPLYGYPAGSWGPEAADNLMESGMT